MTKECSFSPSLHKTKSYNKRSPSVCLVDSESTFDRNLDWLERRDHSLDIQRIEKIQQVEKALTFRPKTNKLSEHDLKKSPNLKCTIIPEDNT